MTRKTWFIAGGVVAGLGVAAALAAPPLLERRAQEATDAFIAGLAREGGVTVARDATHFDIWSRTIRVDGLTVRSETADLPFTAKAGTVSIEGIGALKLLAGHALGQTEGQNPLDAFRQVSIQRLTIPRIDIEAPQPAAAGPFKATYENVALSDLAGGIAGSLSMEKGTINFGIAEADVTVGDVTTGRLAYQDIDIATYASLYIPDAPRSDQMTTIARAFTADGVSFAMTNPDNKDKTLTFTVGPVSSGAMRLRPSALNMVEINKLALALEQSQKEGRDLTDEEVARTLTFIVDYSRSIEMDRVTVDSISIVGAGEPAMTLRIGTTVMEAPRAGELALLEVRDMTGEHAGNRFVVKRYGIEKLDGSGILGYLEGLAGRSLEEAISPSFRELMRIIPRGSVFVEGVDVATEDRALKIGDYRLTLSGPADAMVQGVALSMEGLDVPLPEDDERVAVLRDIGIERLQGSGGAALSLDAQGVLTLDRLGVDLAKLAAVTLTAKTRPIDVQALDAAEDIETATALLADAPLDSATLTVEDRDGGIDRFIASAASGQGVDAATLKAGLELQIAALGPALLGDSADKVTPALSAFVKEPKKLTLTGKAKDEDMSALAIVIAAQMMPDTLHELLDITATAD